MKFLKPLISLVLAIFLPLGALLWYSNLPDPEPEIPAQLKVLGVHGFDGKRLEEILLSDPSLTLDGQRLIFACPTTLLATASEPGLCGYCKFSDAIVYPSWQAGFTERLKPADFDFRSFYDDVLHKRYIMKAHTEEKLFLEAANDGWQPAKGKWFSCRNDEELDVNAYVEIRYSDKSRHDFNYTLGPYEALSVPRPQPFAN